MSAPKTAAEALRRQITEREWQSTVEQMATVCGWLVYHAPDNMPRKTKGGGQYVQNVRAGFPDLVLVKGERLIFAELKRETGSTSAEQDVWLAKLAGAGAEVYVWRPRDLAQVKAVLNGRAA